MGREGEGPAVEGVPQRRESHKGGAPAPPVRPKAAPTQLNTVVGAAEGAVEGETAAAGGETMAVDGETAAEEGETAAVEGATTAVTVVVDGLLRRLAADGGGGTLCPEPSCGV